MDSYSNTCSRDLDAFAFSLDMSSMLWLAVFPFDSAFIVWQLATSDNMRR